MVGLLQRKSLILFSNFNLRNCLLSILLGFRLLVGPGARKWAISQGIAVCDPDFLISSKFELENDL